MVAIFLFATYKLRYVDAIMNFSSVCFVIAVVWFLCFFKFESRILKFIGAHTFSNFILQRIPFMVLHALIPNMPETPMVFVAVSFVITLVMSIVFDKTTKVVDDKMISLFLRG